MTRYYNLRSAAVGVFLICCFTCIPGKIFTRCEVYDILWVHGIPEKDIPFWICVAERSGLNSSLNRDPVMGIFLIHTGYWLGNCKMKKEDFLDDNIFDDLACAKYIFRIDKRDFGSGYSAFQSNWCEKDNAKYIEGCVDKPTKPTTPVANPAIIERIDIS